jgi:hypothetical protein
LPDTLAHVPDDAPTLRLADLTAGLLPGVTAAAGSFFAEAVRVCLDSVGHGLDVTLTLDGDVEKTFNFEWVPPTQQMRQTHADAQDATEHAAYAVAFLTVLDITDYTVIRKARKGTGVDWFLGFKDRAFQDAARLEVSGIPSGTPEQISARVRQKLQQTWPSDGHRMPAYVSVTEFGSPRTRLVRKT